MYQNRKLPSEEIKLYERKMSEPLSFNLVKMLTVFVDEGYKIELGENASGLRVTKLQPPAHMEHNYF